MNLNGSIADLQKAAIKLYLKLQQRFKENMLIRELWSSMAEDLSQQKNSLKAVPSSFWNQLQKEHSELQQAVIPYARLQVTDGIKDMPLKGCIESALQFEEPTILKVYIPIIRSLRENLTEPALEFYIMVKAHLARIAGMTASFSGDPVIIQRSSLLLQTFEREIQEPPAEVVIPRRKAVAGKSARRRATAAKPRTPKKTAKTRKAVSKPARKRKGPAVKSKGSAAKRKSPAQKRRSPAVKRGVIQKAAKPKKPAAKKAATRSSALAKRTKTRHHRTKPLAKKVNIRRGRARARR